MSCANSRHPGASAPCATPIPDIRRRAPSRAVTRRHAPPRAAARVGFSFPALKNADLAGVWGDGAALLYIQTPDRPPMAVSSTSIGTSTSIRTRTSTVLVLVVLVVRVALEVLVPVHLVLGTAIGGRSGV